MTRHSNRASQAGVGLIEVLIAVLVLAIGLLGLAALQAVTLKNSGSSASRTQAVIQIYTMFDMIRADRANFANYNTNTYKSGDGTTTGVSLNGWLNTIKAGDGAVAPDAKGKVVCAAAASLSCTVGVQWDDSRGSGGTTGNGQQTIELTSQL